MRLVAGVLAGASVAKYKTRKLHVLVARSHVVEWVKKLPRKYDAREGCIIIIRVSVVELVQSHVT